MRNTFTGFFVTSLLVQSIYAGEALAAISTDSMNINMTIVDECTIEKTTAMDFGSKGIIDSNIDETSQIDVICTKDTPYTVGLSAGDGKDASMASRQMTGGSSDTITYALYRDATRTQIWGKTIGADTGSYTGNGKRQTLTVYGRVPPQPSPTPGSYSDVVTVSLEY